jgi:hypothetical protein
MELAVLGAGVYLAQSLFDDGTRTKVHDSKREEAQDKLETPEEQFMHQAREHGMIAPSYNSQTNRVPWTPSRPPYVIQAANAGSHTENVTETIYQHRANAQEHFRLGTTEAIRHGRQTFMRKRGLPIYTGFTREMHNPADARMCTDIQDWRFLPAHPTDTDRNDAAALAKRIPVDDTLFTPDAVWMTVPGQTFRYGT